MFNKRENKNEPEETFRQGGKFMKKKFVSALIAGVMMLGACIPLAGCGKDEDKSGYVSLDINPSVELVVDENGLVAGVRGVNEDGLVLLYNESGIKGETVDDAVKKIVDISIEEGYLTEDNKVVNVTVSAKDDKYVKKLTDNVNASIKASADESGLSVKIDAEGTYSLRRRLDEFKKAHPDNKLVQSLSLAKFKLALTISETGEISLESAVELEDDELIDLIKEYDSKIEAFATDAYELAKKQAQAAFDKAVTYKTYSAYTEFYAKNLLTHYSTAYLGAVYQTYASAALMMESVKNVAEFANKVADYPLNDEQIAAVVDALGLEDSEQLKNSKGEVTVRSVEAYADKLFKNSELNQDIQNKMNELTEVLSSTEKKVKEEINAIAEEYKDEIALAAETIENVSKTVETAINLIPEQYRQAFADVITELKKNVADIKAWAESEKTYFSDLDTFTARLEEQRDKYLGKIKEDLTEEEWDAIQKGIEADIAKAEVYKKNYNDALAKAEAEAKAYLDKLKGERKQQA